jgi:D-glycero-D-manno-heptose 1,7-bisphosphate phosphatase
MKVIILDRDGVINQEIGKPIITPEEWQPIPGSIAAIARLSQAGFIIAIATNQSIISKQLISVAGLNQIHHKMQGLVQQQGGQIDQIFFCPHQETEGCDCRKPKSGMLKQIAAKYQLNFAEQKIPFVGDDVRDLKAAEDCGAQPILVLTGKGQTTQTRINRAPTKLPEGLMVFPGLEEFAAEWILRHG